VIRAKVDRPKHVHVGLELATHRAFRAKLLELGTTMQEVYEALAVAVAEGSPSMVAFVQRTVRNRIKAELAEAGLRPMKGMKPTQPRINDLDENVLYDMISEDPPEGDDDNEAA
jgi:hypothetical protein